MKNLLLLMALLLGCHAMAQDVIVKGTVTDASDGSPLVGVNVLVKGTYIGTTTDGGGEFFNKDAPR